MMEPKHVLVVDDDKGFTEFFAEFLGNLGHTTHIATNGPEALEIIERHHPAVMLLDMRLPGMDGIQVLKAAKLRSPGTKVIVITAYDEKYEQEAKRNGAEAFFIKPIPMRELVEKFEMLMARH